MNTQLLVAEDSLNRLITDEVLENALLIAEDNLRVFASQPNFLLKIQLAFGQNFDVSIARNLQQDWAQSYFQSKPDINIRSAAEMNGAWGAFAQSTNTIYFSQEFLFQNRENPEIIAKVWLEEFGHYVDSIINKEDSFGDEGAIFATLVQDGELDKIKLQRLKKHL